MISTAASGRVARYINYYISSGVGKDVKRTQQFNGKLQNVDVEKPNIGHLNIDKNPDIERKVIAEIRATIYADHRPAPTTKGQTRSGTDRMSMKQSTISEGSTQTSSK